MLDACVGLGLFIKKFTESSRLLFVISRAYLESTSEKPISYRVYRLVISGSKLFLLGC